MDKKLVYFLELFLIVIVPLLSIGFDIFENSPEYNKIFGFLDIQKVMDSEFTSAHLNPDRILLSREHSEFENVWNLIKTNTLIELPDEEPKYIMRLGVKNAPYSPWINDSKYTLIPESVPIIVGYCDESDPFNLKCDFNDAIIIGTVEDFKRWVLEKQHSIRIMTSLFLSIFSILLGVIIHFSKKSRRKKK